MKRKADVNSIWKIRTRSLNKIGAYKYKIDNINSDNMADEESEWETVDISDEEIARQLNEREGGRKAGRGDSPYTQEFYEKTYGLDKKKEKKS